MFNKISKFVVATMILSVPRLAQAQVITNPIYNPWINPIGNLGIQSQIDERNRLLKNRKAPNNNSTAPAKLSSSKLAYKPSND
jgi:hypothetical protein